MEQIALDSVAFILPTKLVYIYYCQAEMRKCAQPHCLTMHSIFCYQYSEISVAGIWEKTATCFSIVEIFCCR